MTDFSQRDPVDGIDAQFWQRWSPRAFEKIALAPDVISRLIDAARWTPSCYNEQPWRFYTSNPDNFDDYLSLLVEANQRWACNAAVLGFLVARKTFTNSGDVNALAEFDAGAAWMALALQAHAEGLHTHGMGGIKRDAVAAYLGIDTSEYTVLIGFAVGKQADADTLTEEQRAREIPNSRLPLQTIWCSS